MPGVDGKWGMTTIQVQSEVSLDALLNGVEQLNTADLEHFADKVLELRAKRRAPSIPRREADLLQQINQGVPQGMQQRFDELTARRRADVLTPEEHQELLQLIDQIEQLDVKRMEGLAELAQLRKVSLRKLMKQLGLRPPAYA
jgi:hypothetical protein